MMKSKSNKAFTLIELLVVIAIIAILAAILFPVLSQARIAAKKIQTTSALKQHGLSIFMYSTDNDGALPHAVSGGCEGLAATANSLWSRQTFPYVKSVDLYKDEMASTKAPGFRFNANVTIPDVPVAANPAPCGDTNTDRRAMPIGINRSFLAYFSCDNGSQIGCSSDIWGDEPITPANNAACVGQYATDTIIQEPSRMVVFATTQTGCTAGYQGYLATPQAPLNTIDGMTKRNGQGSIVAFADGHAKFYPATEDAQLTTLLGTKGFISPLQNRKAVILRAQGNGNRVNGVANCVNHTPSGVYWNFHVQLKGENAALDTLCN